MAMNLYELPIELDRVLSDETEYGDKIDEAEQLRRIQEFLSASTEAVEQAVDYLRHLEMETGEIDKRIATLKAKKIAREATYDRISGQLIFVLDQVLSGKLKTTEFTAYTKGNTSKSIELKEGTDLQAIPDRFKRTTTSLNKDEIKEALKAGEVLPEGVEVVTKTSRSLIIR